LPITILLKLQKLLELRYTVFSAQHRDDVLQIHKGTVYFSVHFTNHLAFVCTTLYSVGRFTVFDITEAG